MFDELKNLIDFEQAEMEKQNKSLRRGTIFWALLWIISLAVFTVLDIDKSVLWVWLLGIYFEYYRIKDGNLATYRARVNSYMLNEISKKLPAKVE